MRTVIATGGTVGMAEWIIDGMVYLVYIFHNKHFYRRFRKNGISQLKDSTEYEVQRLRRIKRKNDLKRRMENTNFDVMSNSPMSFRSGDEMSGGVGSPGMALSPAKNVLEEKVRLLIDPLGRPTVIACRDHCFRTCCLFVRLSQNLKIKRKSLPARTADWPVDH